MYSFYQIDAFTDKPFEGNPAAVVVTDKDLKDDLMQNLAMENNLSETVFLTKKEDHYSIRWFTPTTEVDLCGHATLASAYTLYNFFEYPKDKPIIFKSSRYTLKASFKDDWISLEFPTKETNLLNCDKTLSYFNGALEGCQIKRIHATKLHHHADDLIIEIAKKEELENLKPNFEKIANSTYRGVLVTTKGDESFDIYSRCFFPKDGILEDPVTGSAHCALVTYWSKLLDKTSFTARQLSKRTGTLKLSLDGDNLTIKGQATAVLKGEILL